MNPTPTFEKGTRVRVAFHVEAEVAEVSVLYPGFVWVRFAGDQKATRVWASQLEAIEPGEPGRGPRKEMTA